MTIGYGGIPRRRQGRLQRRSERALVEDHARGARCVRLDEFRPGAEGPRIVAGRRQLARPAQNLADG
jgi:hypothetical protein